MAPWCQTLLTCSDSSSLMLVRPNMVALTVDRILSWVLIVGMRSHTLKEIRNITYKNTSNCLCKLGKRGNGWTTWWRQLKLTCSRLVRIRLSVHCLATSLASRVTSSEALAMSLAHWMSARLFPLPPRTRRDISAMRRAIRLAAPMISFPYKAQKEHNQSLKKTNISAMHLITSSCGKLLISWYVELAGKPAFSVSKKDL